MASSCCAGGYALVLVLAAPPGTDEPAPTPEIGVACPGAPLPAERAPDGTPLPAEVAAAAGRLQPQLFAAQRARDPDAVAAAVCAQREALGAWQGVAEAVPERRAAPAAPLDPEALLTKYLALLQRDLLGQEPWVAAGGSLHGDALSQPLREACAVVQAYAELLPWAGAARPQLAAALAQGANYLVQVQRPDGVFPFPDLTDDAARFMTRCRASGDSEEVCRARMPRALELAVLAKDAWERAGRPAGVLVDGWFAQDEDGGLQFDTGSCGAALLIAARALDEPRYAAAARRAGEWAMSEELVPNWNYNAFSVELQALLAAEDARVGDLAGATRWTAAALDRARLGVLPGALADGRWYDPHNARLVYHHILLRALARLAAVVDDAKVAATLDAALARSVEEIERQGAAGWSDGIAAYLAARAAGRQPGPTLWRLVQAAAPGGNPATLQLASYLAATLPAR